MCYFVDTAIQCRDVAESRSTHLAIMNRGKIRYLISNHPQLKDTSRRKLQQNIAAYSVKLGMLMRSVSIVPVFIFKLLHLGRTVEVEIPEEILDTLTAIAQKRWPGKQWSYNVIVGSYVKKQKVVFQCFCDDETVPAIYCKICGDNARREIEDETDYLRTPMRSESFLNPRLCYSKLQREGAQFNVQVTEEFSGEKVSSKMNSNVFRMYKELSAFKHEVGEKGRLLSFSHGDFVPWNMRKTENGYVLFDWEYCGMRFYGFDLIHYNWQVQNKLFGKSNQEAIQESIRIAKEYDAILRNYSNEELEKMYFTELKKQFGDIL